MPIMGHNPLNKVVKEAFKKGMLHMGAVNGGFVIVALDMIMWINLDYMPPKLKALATEYLGFLPQREAMFNIIEQGEFDEYGIHDHANSYHEIISNMRGTMYDGLFTHLSPTPILVEKDLSIHRILQDSGSNDVYAVGEKYLNIIDRKQIDFDVESELYGPALRKVNDQLEMVVYRTGINFVAFRTTKLDTNKLEAFSGMLKFLDMSVQG